MKLSVLDQSPIRAGETGEDAIRETLALASLAEELGYARYWVSEHHNSPSVAGTAPEILIAAIAARTSSIRVGSAGVMLPHYASLKVAEVFRVLEAVAPGRIDLGLGRAPGSDMATAMTLNPNVRGQADRFASQVQEVAALLEGRPLGTSFPGHTVVAEPRGASVPAIWILGSSDWGAQAAAMLGLPYCFAYFFSDGRGAEDAIEVYKHFFRPGERLVAPHCAVCVFAIAAETEAQAWRLHRSREVWRLDLERGSFKPLVSVEEAEARVLTPSEEARVAQMREHAFVGTAAQVVGKLRALREALGVDEIAVVTATFDAQARRTSYRLVAEEAGLRPEPRQGPGPWTSPDGVRGEGALS